MNNKTNKHSNSNYRKAFDPNINHIYNKHNEKYEHKNEATETSSKYNFNNNLNDKGLNINYTPCGFINKFSLPLKDTNKPTYSKQELIEAKRAVQHLLIKSNNNNKKPPYSAISNKDKIRIHSNKQEQDKMNKSNYKFRQTNYSEHEVGVDKVEKEQEYFNRKNKEVDNNFVVIKNKPNLMNPNNPIDVIPSNKIDYNEVYYKGMEEAQNKPKLRKEDNKNNFNKFKTNNNYNNNYNNAKKNNNNIINKNTNVNDNEYNKDKNIDYIDYNEDDDRPAFSNNNNFNEIEHENEDEDPKEQCPDCGRMFNISAFKKHIKICKKVFMKKRKAFNSKLHRIADKDQAELLEKNQYSEKLNKKINKDNNNNNATNNTTTKPKKKKDWRIESEMFRNAMRANKDINTNNNNYTLNNNNPKSNFNNNNNYDYSNNGLDPCNVCGRTFNEEALKRHAPICQKKAKENAIKKKNFKK